MARGRQKQKEIVMDDEREKLHKIFDNAANWDRLSLQEKLDHTKEVFENTEERLKQLADGVDVLLAQLAIGCVILGFHAEEKDLRVVHEEFDKAIRRYSSKLMMRCVEEEDRLNKGIKNG